MNREQVTIMRLVHKSALHIHNTNTRDLSGRRGDRNRLLIRPSSRELAVKRLTVNFPSVAVGGPI